MVRYLTFGVCDLTLPVPARAREPWTSPMIRGLCFVFYCPLEMDGDCGVRRDGDNFLFVRYIAAAASSPQVLMLIRPAFPQGILNAHLYSNYGFTPFKTFLGIA